MANGACDVLDASTRNADGVMVIVSNLGFKTSGVTGKINTTQQARIHKIIENHISGLQRKLWKYRQGVAMNFFRGCMRMPTRGLQYTQPLFCDASTHVAQGRGPIHVLRGLARYGRSLSRMIDVGHIPILP